MSEKRRMPVEKDWFDKKSNDIVYGFMQAIAEIKDKEVILAKAEFNKNLPMLKKILGVKDKRTVISKIEALKKAGYIAEDTENYYFPYNKNNFYVLMDRDLLRFMCDTMSTFSIKTYVYLADKNRWKSNYHFTIKELKEAFGYSADNRTIEETITNCLVLLSEAKIITYSKEYVSIANEKGNYKIPNLVLKEIKTTLPASTIEKKEEIAETALPPQSIEAFMKMWKAG